MKTISKISGSLLIVIALFFAGCEEKDNETEEQMDDGAITVKDQIISQNMIAVSSVTINGSSGWVVVHKDDNGSPQVPDIITEPVYLNEGTTENIKLQIKSDVSISEGEKVWVMLHEDTGEEEMYEFEGGDTDSPVTVDGAPLTKSVTLTAPKIIADDQSVSENTVTIDKVVAGIDGWVVIHKDDGSGAPGAVIGHTGVSAGINENVSVALTDTITYSEGMKLFPMLHVDKGNAGEYEFPGDDAPEIFGNSSPNIVLTSFLIESGNGDQEETVTIDISGNAFNPSEQTISAGTTVKWVNNDGYAHTVTSEDGVFDSGNIEGGGSFSYTFESTGDYPYVCTIHSGMSGTITVE